MLPFSIVIIEQLYYRVFVLYVKFEENKILNN